MNKFIGFLLVAIIVGTYGCKKELSTPKTSNKNTSLSVKDIDFEYLNTNSRVKYNGQNKSLSASATIRMKKDSIIWISLSPGFGIEAARGIITQDSIKFLNRLENEYKAYDFKDLSKKFNFSLNFNLMQAIFIGNMPKVRSGADEVVKKDNFYIIKQLEGPLAINNYISQQNMKVSRIAIFATNGPKNAEASLENKVAVFDNHLNLEYENFKVLEKQLLPYDNFLSLNYKRGNKSVETTIDIQHKRATIKESLEFPFNVPDKYE